MIIVTVILSINLIFDKTKFYGYRIHSYNSPIDDHNKTRQDLVFIGKTFCLTSNNMSGIASFSWSELQRYDENCKELKNALERHHIPFQWGVHVIETAVHDNEIIKEFYKEK